PKFSERSLRAPGRSRACFGFVLYPVATTIGYTPNRRCATPQLQPAATRVLKAINIALSMAGFFTFIHSGECRSGSGCRGAWRQCVSSRIRHACGNGSCHPLRQCVPTLLIEVCPATTEASVRHCK